MHQHNYEKIILLIATIAIKYSFDMKMFLIKAFVVQIFLST